MKPRILFAHAKSEDSDAITNGIDLIQSLFTVMQETSADFTNTFRSLSLLSRDQSDKDSLTNLVELIAS
jgi:uncharacterized protein YdiU (UPF0061 family)